MTPSVVEGLRCPRCASPIDVSAQPISCPACGRSYPRLGAIPILLPDAEGYVSSCCEQIALFEHQAALTSKIIDRHLHTDAVLPLTRIRCERMIEAVEGQVADVRAILEPVLPQAWPTASAAAGTADSLPGPLRHVHNLYRDWGWPSDPDGENERALGLVEAVLHGRPLGRTLILGAGGCRLAYDLHRRAGATDTLAVDIDPLALTVARTVILGGSAALREANAEIDEMEGVAKIWTLAARHGALDDGRFEFLIADGLEPPFEPGMFDTVVTPWFIDLIPPDVRDLMSTIHRLLKPGGRWVNVGPLRYTADLPVSRRFTREEVFDLAARAGFYVEDWRADSQPYLVSKLSGRGKVEWVLAFAAIKREKEGLVAEGSVDSANVIDDVGGPPAWLMFSHLSIPMFDGQPSAASDDPVRQAVVGAIDGTRTLADLAAIVASRTGRTDLPLSEIRAAVRRYLAEIHPAARLAR